MSKKTFNIASLFNARNDDKCLEEVLIEVLAEQELDQQDVIDIIETASNNYRKAHSFYTGRADSSIRPGQPFVFNQFGHTGRFGHLRSEATASYGNLTTYTTAEHPMFFENLFKVLEFEIRYNTTLLTQNFKFLAAEGGEHLVYLGRDKEVLPIKGTATLSGENFNLQLGAMGGLGIVNIRTTPASYEAMIEALRDGSLVRPDQQPFSADTRSLMLHLRNQAWRGLQEGDLVTMIDRLEAPETVFLLGRIEHQQEEYNGQSTQAVVMPVSVHYDGKEITTVPMGGSIHKVDLMMLKPWVYKG